MSLLTSLVTQIAQSALQGRNNPMGNPMNSPMGNNGGFGGMFGGNAAQANNGFGLDDVLGSVLGGGLNGGMGSSMGGMGGLGGISQGGILGQVLGSVLGGGMGGGFGGMGNGMGMNRSGFGGKGMLMAALLPLALMFIQRNGGLSGALDKVRNMGFGQHANSWMSTNEPNQALDPQAVSQLFDDQELEQVAAQTGTDTNEVRQGMAELLPQVFDNLTPNGDANTDSQANQEISDLLAQLNRSH